VELYKEYREVPKAGFAVILPLLYPNTEMTHSLCSGSMSDQLHKLNYHFSVFYIKRGGVAKSEK